MEKQQIQRWLRWILAAALAVSYALAAYSVVRSGLIPAKYLTVSLVVATLIVGLLVFALLKKMSLGKRIPVVIASLLVVAGSLYGFAVSSATSEFLSTIQEDEFTSIEYSILAKTDRNIDLTTGDTLKAGILALDTNNEGVKTEAGKKMKATYEDYPEITSLTLAVTDDEADVAVVKSSYTQLLEENYDEFYESVEVLDTFVIQVPRDTKAAKTDLTKPFIVYISGIDTYGRISNISRSDVNILVVVNPVTNKILLVNTPRDYYVQLNGTTGVRDKLTHAGIYGVETSEKTLEDLYGTEIDFYMKVNFSSLTKIVDALGGITVQSEYDFEAGYDKFYAGTNNLDAEEALNFSRARYVFEDGDRTRGENQQRVIQGIIQKLNNPRSLVNYQNILASAQDSIQTNMTGDEISSLVRDQLNNMQNWETESISVDGADSQNVTYSLGRIPVYVMEPDPASVDAAKQKIQQYKGDKI